MIMLIYGFLKVVAALALLLCAYTIICYLLNSRNMSFNTWSRQFQDNVSGFWGDIAKPFLILALIATLITNTAIHQIVGIHNLELKPDGVYCFYVEASRSSEKSYTLPAQILVVTESFEAGEGRNVNRRKYYIQQVFFSNGGYLDTNECESIEIGEACCYYDTNTDDEWDLVLLNEHAYSPHVVESNNANWLNTILLVVKLSSISFTLYVLCHKRKSINHQESLVSL